MESDNIHEPDKTDDTVMQPETNSTPAEQKSETKINTSKTKKIIAGVLIFLVAIAALAAAYFYIYIPNTPNNVLMTGLYNTYADSKIKSGKLDGTVKITGKDAPRFLGEIAFSGSFDEKGNVSYLVSTEVAGNPLSADITKVGEDTYVKLSGTKDLQSIIKDIKAEKYIGKNSSQTFSILSGLDGKWVKVDETFSQLTSSLTGPFKTTELSDKDTQKVVELYKQNPFIQIEEVLADEDIEGTPSKHFKATIDEENYLNYLKGMKEANIPQIFIDVPAEGYQKNKDVLDESFEIWVSKPDKVINKMIVTVSSKDSSTSISITKTDINEPQTIVAPSDAQSFTDYVKSKIKTTN